MTSTKHLKVGDRVVVTATVGEMLAVGIPESFARAAYGKELFVVRPPSSYDVALSFVPNPQMPYDYWYFYTSMICPVAVVVPATPPLAPTIYATTRLVDAQELLHQLDSIRRQAQLLTGEVFSEHSRIRDALTAVMAEEIDNQQKSES